MGKNRKSRENRRKNQPKTRKYAAQRRESLVGMNERMRKRYQAKTADELKKRRSSSYEEQPPENECAQATDTVTEEIAVISATAGQQAVELAKHNVQRVRELRRIIKDAPPSQSWADPEHGHMHLAERIAPERNDTALQTAKQPVRLQETGRAVLLHPNPAQERGKRLFRCKRIKAVRVKLRRRDTDNAHMIESGESPFESDPIYPIAERNPAQGASIQPAPLPYPITICRKELLSQERRRKERINRSSPAKANAAHTEQFARAVDQRVQKVRLARRGRASVAAIVQRFVQATTSLARGTAGWLSGGLVLLLLLLLTGMVGALVSSPFGVLFSPQETSPEARSISAAIAETNNEYFDHINEIISNTAHDRLVIQRIPNDGAADTQIHTWEEILAVFAVKTTTDPDHAADVVLIDADRTARLKEVFWDMVTVSHRVEVIGRGEEETRTLYLTISVQTPAQAAADYRFSKIQIGALEEMLLPENKMLLTALTGRATGTGGGYHVPDKALSDERFAAMLTEAEKYLGFPYVWGGSTPQTSFDCSGFVCWVLNQSGVMEIERTTATGIYNRCTVIPKQDARPGDLVFFTGTYHSPGPISHIGIYVGEGMMIHAGDPIQYSSIETAYWQEHFYAMTRIPS